MGVTLGSSVAVAVAVSVGVAVITSVTTISLIIISSVPSRVGVGVAELVFRYTTPIVRPQHSKPATKTIAITIQNDRSGSWCGSMSFFGS